MEINLNDVLGNAFYAQEQEEAKSRQIEDLIKSCKKLVNIKSFQFNGLKILSNL